MSQGTSTPQVDYLEHLLLNTMEDLAAAYAAHLNTIPEEHRPHHWMEWARAQIQMVYTDLTGDLPQYRRDCMKDAPFHGEESNNSQNAQNSLQATRTPDHATNAMR